MINIFNLKKVTRKLIIIKKMQKLMRKSNDNNLAILRASELNFESSHNDNNDNDIIIDS
jgi:hypothetical protein